jgi:transcriptional regulator with XRE-family HTH domain
MLSFNRNTPESIAERLAERIRTLRLERGWSRAELSRRAGVATPTLRHFEDTGRVSLERLLKLASVLGLLEEFAAIASKPTTPRTMAELEALIDTRTRKRGRTSKQPRQ